MGQKRICGMIWYDMVGRFVFFRVTRLPLAGVSNECLACMGLISDVLVMFCRGSNSNVTRFLRTEIRDRVRNVAQMIGRLST